MADIKLPNMKARVEVDSKGVDAGLNRIQASTRNAGKGFEGMQKSASGAIDNLTSSLTSRLGPASGQAKAALDGIGASALASGGLMKTAMAGGVAVAGAALAAFAADGARQFVNLAGEVRNFQRASGASAEESSRFVAVLDDMGIASDKGATAVFKLGKNVADGGTKLAAFGIEVARNKDGTADLTGTMLNVADAYQRTTDPAKRAELAFAAFGKQGRDLIPLLEQGREGLKKFFEGAEGGRQIFSQADLDKARAFELQMDELSDEFRGLKLEAGEALLPFLTDLAKGAVAVLGLISDINKLIPVLESLGGKSNAKTGNPVADLIINMVGLKLKTNEAKTAGDGLKQTNEEVAAAALEAARASEAQALALDRVVAATLSALSSQVGYEQSVNTLKDNINDLDDRQREYNEAVAENGVNSKEAEAANRALRDAHLGIESSALAAAAAAVRVADDVATAGGEALTAQQKSDIFKSALYNLAAQADGPTKESILRLADKIDELPNRTVEIDADTSSAHAKLAQLERRLAAVNAKPAEFWAPTTGDVEREHGGPVTAGRPYIVGEKRPELFVPDVNGRIIPRVPMAYSPGSTSASSTAAPPPVVHTTIVVDRKVLAAATSQGQYENRKR